MTPLLTITYTPQYQGCHRVCFRTTQLQYCCYLDNSGSTIGTPKTVDIYLSNYTQCLGFIPSEISCNGDTAVTGYIQPCCSDETSLSNRTAFTATFASTECTSYNILCPESGIGELTINNPGYGWPVGVTPTISVIDSFLYGSGFVTSVTMNCEPGDSYCSIDSITIENPGINYYYLNLISVDVSPLPSCIGEELIVDGAFTNGLNDWTVNPIVSPAAWYMSGSNARYAIDIYGGTLPGSLSQNVLTPGKTYDISFSLEIGVSSGIGNVIVTAGTFDPSGTQPNQYLHVQNPGPIFNGLITATLPCVGTNEFSIYVSSTTPSIASRVEIYNVSVVQQCTVIEPDIEVTALDDCGTFTVPNCDGTDNPITYELLGNPDFSINVCAGGTGPDAPKYDVVPSIVSCCDCRLYQVIVNSEIDIYYTDCNQTIDVVTVQTGLQGVTVCAIPDSIFTVNKLDRLEIISITEVGTCIPNQ